MSGLTPSVSAASNAIRCTATVSGKIDSSSPSRSSGHAGHRHARLFGGLCHFGDPRRTGSAAIEQCGVNAFPHRFRHHFSHTWLDRGGPEGDLMELAGWASPQMLRRYGASARSARARRTYDRIMTDT